MESCNIVTKGVLSIEKASWYNETENICTFFYQDLSDEIKPLEEDRSKKEEEVNKILGRFFDDIAIKFPEITRVITDESRRKKMIELFMRKLNKSKDITEADEKILQALKEILKAMTPMLNSCMSIWKGIEARRLPIKTLSDEIQEKRESMESSKQKFRATVGAIYGDTYLQLLTYRESPTDTKQPKKKVDPPNEDVLPKDIPPPEDSLLKIDPLILQEMAKKRAGRDNPSE